MRTDLTATLAGSEVRGVVTVAAWEEMVGERTWAEFLGALDAGDPRLIRAVLRACIRAAGDLRPLDVPGEVDRLIEEAGVIACHAFAVRLVNDALHKAETARKNGPAAGAKTTTPAASDTTR